MRPFSVPDQYIYGGGEPKWSIRLGLETADGAFVNFADILDEDWVKSVDWGDSLDAPGQDLNARVSFRRFVDNASPWVEGTRRSDAMQLKRRVVVQARLYCEGMHPTQGVFMLLFDGEVNGITLNGNEATITARDRIVAETQDSWIEQEVLLGESEGRRLDLACIDAIRAAQCDPTIVRFRADDVPTFAINEYKQQPMAALAALKALVALIGWDVRPVWSEVDSAFALTLVDVERSPAETTHTFYPGEYRTTPRTEIRLDDIRNAVEVWYTDGTLEGGVYKKEYETAQNDTSIAKYGRRWMEIGEGSTSPINTSEEAQALATAAMQDLSEPEMQFDVELRFFPWVEVNDFYEFRPDGLHFGASQELAVYAYRHTADQSGIKTLLQVRGKPSAGRVNWLEKEARPGLKRARPTTLAFMPGVATAESSTEGARVSWEWPRDGSHDMTEVHRGTSSSFVPTADTLVDMTRGRAYLDRTATPGTEYHYRLKSVDRDGNTSAATPSLKASANPITRDKLEPAVQVGIQVGLSGDQTGMDIGDKVDFDSLIFGNAALHSIAFNTITPALNGIAHLSLTLEPSGSSEMVTWYAEIKSGATVVAKTPTRSGDEALQISQPVKLVGTEVLEVRMYYTGSTGGIEQTGSQWSLVASVAGGNPTPQAATPKPDGVPVITGTPEVGHVLTADNGGWIADDLGDLTFTHQYFADGVEAGASSTLTLLEEHESKYIDVIVTATHPASGSAWQKSERVGPVLAVVQLPQNITPPAITIGS